MGKAFRQGRVEETAAIEMVGQRLFRHMHSLVVTERLYDLGNSLYVNPTLVFLPKSLYRRIESRGFTGDSDGPSSKPSQDVNRSVDRSARHHYDHPERAGRRAAKAAVAPDRNAYRQRRQAWPQARPSARFLPQR